MKEVSFTYTGAAPGRLDKILHEYLESAHPEHLPTRSQLKQLIESGNVSVNQKPAQKAGFLVKPGNGVSLILEEPSAEHLNPMELPLAVLYEDEALIVIDKPSGLSIHPGAGNKNRTLVNALVHHFGKQMPELFSHGARPGIVHRLDRDTTGVVVVAKTAKAHAALAAQFAARSIGREYRAIVFRTPRSLRAINTADEGRIEGNIGRDPHHRKRMAVVEGGGKSAVTHWKVLERMHYGCLVAVKLETGRTHQIRVHMNHIGAPILGDKLYGSFEGLPPKLRIAADKLGRQALHAAVLEFDHPLTKKRQRFESPLPTDFQKLLNLMRQDGAA